MLSKMPYNRPLWLNKKISIKDCRKVGGLLKGLDIHTVCQEASCPNISECFGKNEATFLILGKFCTRNCSFCNVEHRDPLPLDLKEPGRIVNAVKQLGIKHIVITSVTRDDLPDGGAEVFAITIASIREKINGATIEVLIPDFKGDEGSIKKVVSAGPDIIGHNVETVPRLYRDIRPQANYKVSLNVLSAIKKLDNTNRIYTKSGIMLGMGETKDEVLAVFSDLRNINCDFISIGQYLRPSLSHYPVKKYIKPSMFLYYKAMAKKAGFLHVESAPYVRSSYRAKEYLK